VFPASGATEVDTSTKITITFDVSMDLTYSAIKINGVLVTGTWDTTNVLSYSSGFATNYKINVVVPKSHKSAATWNTLEKDYSFNFESGGGDEWATPTYKVIKINDDPDIDETTYGIARHIYERQFNETYSRPNMLCGVASMSMYLKLMRFYDNSGANPKIYEWTRPDLDQMTFYCADYFYTDSVNDQIFPTSEDLDNMALRGLYAEEIADILNSFNSSNFFNDSWFRSSETIEDILSTQGTMIFHVYQGARYGLYDIKLRYPTIGGFSQYEGIGGHAVLIYGIEYYQEFEAKYPDIQEVTNKYKQTIFFYILDPDNTEPTYNRWTSDNSRQWKFILEYNPIRSIRNKIVENSGNW